jgi:hypothetical protein
MYVGALVHPAALPVRFRPDLAGGLPERERAIGDGELRRHVEPAALQLKQQIAPILAESACDVIIEPDYRSFGGKVEVLSTPMICRVPDSRRHQLSAIAPHAERFGIGYVRRKWHCSNASWQVS